MKVLRVVYRKDTYFGKYCTISLCDVIEKGKDVMLVDNGKFIERYDKEGIRIGHYIASSLHKVFTKRQAKGIFDLDRYTFDNIKMSLFDKEKVIEFMNE